MAQPLTGAENGWSISHTVHQIYTYAYHIYDLSLIIYLAFIINDDQISTPLLKIQRYDNYIMLFDSLYISYTTIKV